MIQLVLHTALFCAGALLLAVLTGFMYQVTGRYVINYKIRPSCVEIAVLGFLPIRRIAYGNIISAREVRFRSLRDFADPKMFGRYLFALRLGNRVVGTGVLIELKAGICRAVFISPDDAPAFVAAVMQRLPRAGPPDGDELKDDGHQN